MATIEQLSAALVKADAAGDTAAARALAATLKARFAAVGGGHNMMTEAPEPVLAALRSALA